MLEFAHITENFQTIESVDHTEHPAPLRIYLVFRRLVIGVILALVVLAPSANAFAALPLQQNAALTLDVRAGFDSYLQSATWVPISVTASNTGQGVEGELRVSVEGFTGTGEVVYTYPISLPQGSRKQVRLYPADLNAFGQEIQVDLLDTRGRVLLSERVRVQYISAETLLIGILSDAPATLDAISEVKPTYGETKVAILTVDDLPEVGMGWTSLDVLVISDVDTGQMSDAQQAALRDWVLGGGRLIIVGGPDFQRTLAGLQGITPLTGQSAVNMSVLPLTSAVGQPLDAQADTEALVTTGDLVEGATVLVSNGDVPLLATYGLGYGRVDFLAADPALEPLRSWSEMGALWQMILSSGEVRPGWAYGFNTNSWQNAQDAAASVPGVQLPSVIQLCGFLGVYVLLIGPVNYIILSRLKRRELAWLTIPVLVVLFSAIAYVTGFQLRGSQVIMHRLSIVHAWEGGDTAKVQSMLGIWSPRRTRYDITVEPGYYARPMPQGFNSGFSAPANSIVDQSDPVTLRGVQVDVGSIQNFVVEGYDESPLSIESDLEVTTEGNGVRVQGTIQNESDFDLEHVMVIIAGTARKVDDIPAGEVVDVNLLLTGGQSMPGGGLPYDPAPMTGPYGGYYYYDPLMTEIADVGDCYTTDEEKRRCDMLLSVLSAQWRGSGIVLTAFAETSPVELDVLNGSTKTIDQSLFFVELGEATITAGDDIGVITPGLMTWQLMSDPTTTGYVASPYDFYLGQYDNPVIFHFQPIALAQVPLINVIDLHLETYYGDGQNIPRVSALNLETGTWDRLDVDWGTSRIEDAQRYVDSSGGVTLSIDSAGGDHNIVRFDVTLRED